MHRFRRWFSAAWLGALLNALSPVLAYAHSVALPGGLFHEHSAGEASSAEHAHHQHHHDGSGPSEKSKHPDAPQCPYCPGFAAGAALAQFVFPIAAETHPAVPALLGGSDAPGRRSLLRIAQPRAPPLIS